MAATRIINKFPELQSANINLLRRLMELAWMDGRASFYAEQARAIEAELIEKGAEL